ncbi:hypothetical protein [uncultured Hydrogenophaga sp.]|uniref:hypothetical protein n=1 Tax=uncultured Hydrogenophaga sp. TaxID=199683 RepID=UPI00258A4B6A|nr:hypothetical protein [uncultured Hydrogenophaga sp.]
MLLGRQRVAAQAVRQLLAALVQQGAQVVLRARWRGIAVRHVRLLVFIDDEQQLPGNVGVRNTVHDDARE